MKEILILLHYIKVLSVVGELLLTQPDYEFKIDSLPHAEFTLDKDIDCGPFSVSNNNISLSKNDYYATFDWSFSTLINGCRGSTGPSIQKFFQILQ